jgi:GNAT superfamily N-acetyltransferase
MNNRQNEIIIRPFQPSDQDAAKRLILEGLSEHFPHFRPELHPDLDDIQNNYDVFLVAYSAAQLVATGALKVTSEDTAKIMRMSTVTSFRGQGIAAKLLGELEAGANVRGVKKLTMITGEDWIARCFYERYGYLYKDVFRDDTDFQGVWLEKTLS